MSESKFQIMAEVSVVDAQTHYMQDKAWNSKNWLENEYMGALAFSDCDNKHPLELLGYRSGMIVSLNLSIERNSEYVTFDGKTPIFDYEKINNDLLNDKLLYDIYDGFYCVGEIEALRIINLKQIIPLSVALREL